MEKKKRDQSDLFSVRLPEDLRSRLKAAKAKTKRTASKIVRDALVEYLEKESA